MFDWIKDNRASFFFAILLHLFLLTALFINWQVEKPKKIVLQQGNVIEVNAVDANSYNAELRKIEELKAASLKRKQEAAREAREKKRQQALQKQQAEKKAREERLAREKTRQAEVEKKRRQEQQRKETEARKLAEMKAVEEKKKAEARAKEEARRKKEQQRKAEAEKAKAEQARAEKARAEKRKAEAEKKRLAEQKREQERLEAERAIRAKGIIERHLGLIVQRIERSWRRPLNTAAGLSCKIEIKLDASGQVQGVRVLESSGDTVFDKSVETAVRKASPLPVPADSEIFQEFKLMRFTFTPGSY